MSKQKNLEKGMKKAAVGSEQPQFPVARPAAKELKHPRWVSTAQPFRFVHAVTPLPG
jgi:hypothetical protein